MENPSQPGREQETLVGPLKGMEGTAWDKPAVSGPPGQIKAKVPRHLLNVLRFYQGIVADEGLLMDVCVSRAVTILEMTYAERAAGGDFFAEQQPNTATFIMTAAPIAVELYRQALKAIEDRKDEYVKLVEAAQKELEDGQSRIIRPPGL